jgi:hypothetical protein
LTIPGEATYLKRLRNANARETDFGSPGEMDSRDSPNSSATSAPRNPNASSPPDPINTELRSVNMSRNPSVDQKLPRNVDVIPGMAYYVRATEILGLYQGGSELAHVQAYILACLYTGQLACVIQSWKWIDQAARSCRPLVYNDKNAKNDEDPAQRRLIRLAFWSCVQLESDILAEFDFKPSGLQDELVGFPGESAENPLDMEIMWYYAFQVQLRNTLNLIQNELYPPQGDPKPAIPLRNACMEILHNWHLLLLPQLRWKDDDPPSSDINVARLRAKYYGAVYIIHRPILFKALLEGGITATSENERNEIISSLHRCVWAAKKSTVAFDGVWPASRLIVTNIFGTAHA